MSHGLRPVQTIVSRGYNIVSSGPFALVLDADLNVVCRCDCGGQPAAIKVAKDLACPPVEPVVEAVAPPPAPEPVPPPVAEPSVEDEPSQ